MPSTISAFTPWLIRALTFADLPGLSGLLLVTENLTIATFLIIILCFKLIPDSRVYLTARFTAWDICLFFKISDEDLPSTANQLASAPAGCVLFKMELGMGAIGLAKLPTPESRVSTNPEWRKLAKNI